MYYNYRQKEYKRRKVMKKQLVAGLLATSLISFSAQFCLAQSYNYNSYTKPQLQGRVTVLPMGTTFTGVSTADISSADLVVGDNVVLTLNSPFYYKGCLIAPVNSNIVGLVTEAQKAGRADKTGKLKIKFNEIITPDGYRIPISGKVITPDGKGVLMGKATTDKAKDIGKNVALGAAGGALTGVIFGPISGGKVGKGAALGTAVGAGLGLGKTLIDKGSDVTIPAGTPVNVMLDQPATFNN
jgi:hypothetical protein